MKLPGLGPDVEQAIGHLVGLTLAHNFVPLILFAGIAISAAAAVYKPTRPRVLTLIGLSLILLHFEYIKHILPALHAQTQLTLTTETPDYLFIWITEKLLTRAVPFGIAVLGWGSVAAAIVLKYRGKTK